MVSTCGTLLLTTSGRLSRSIERVRNLAQRLDEQPLPPAGQLVKSAEYERLREQLHLAGRSAKLLQDAMTGLYLTLMAFVATIVVLGVFKSLGVSLDWVPLALALLGAVVLLYTSGLLIRESRQAWQGVHREMDYLTKY